MSDISDLLTTIQNEESGEQVRSAIANSLDLLQNGVDISEELYSIRNGRYGADIRNAIHDALKKISEYQPSPEPPEQYVGVSELIFIGTDNSETGIAEPEEELSAMYLNAPLAMLSMDSPDISLSEPAEIEPQIEETEGI